MDTAKLNMLAVQLAAATATLAELLGSAPVKPTKGKKVKADKEPRAATPWGNFTQRVRLLLKEHDLAPKGLETQFCSMLAGKDKAKNYDWSDEAIIAARANWVEPPKKVAEAAEATEAAEPTEPVAPKATKAPKKVVAPVEEVDADKMEANPIKIAGKDYFVNGYGDLFDEADFSYAGSHKGGKIVKGAAPARVVKYLEEMNK